MSEMSKAYEPQGVEDKIYRTWEESGFFNPDNLPDLESRTEVFSMVLPPPNVTGTLHIGHATMLAIEDAMVRFARLRGKKALWVPGTDHAAIATQSKVEGLIYKAEQKTRYDLGREEFLRRVEEFAEKSHDTIVNQCKKMGSSLDWSREAYTLDTDRNTAVNTAFKRMYDDGLIYRGDRIVNWDPQGRTTISDDELVYKEEKSKFYYFQYGPFVIATARPETKFGDKYVVMHPDDERYTEYKDGQTLELEWINGPITATVIKDTSIDMAFGSGVMTITPAHSQVDFEIAQRHGLDKEQVIDLQGKLLPMTGEFAGMDIIEARSKIVDKLEKKGLVVKIDEGYTHNVATAERTGAMIEPQILKQWFVNVNKEFIRDGQPVTLKLLMQNAVRQGSVEILPERFNKIYFNWIDNLRDWNISRQIWFGHRIPVWYRSTELTAGRGEEIAIGEAPTGEGWEQDPDTLDTWFSSGLWTFSTLGWPAQTEDFKAYHPTTILETGYDIIFFWVARMILMSTYLLNEVPFKTVYLHGLVRDEQGRKMSKSLGNIIDPLDMITKFGADATRLSLIIGGTPGNDTRLSEEKIAGFRNFTNKLWNIARFILALETGNGEAKPKTLADEWILGRFSEVVAKVTKLHESYDLSLAGEILRDFTWNDLADWYLEIAKVEGDKGPILRSILHDLLILWHPFMPFVTEEIYKQFDKGLLMVAAWPSREESKLSFDQSSYRDFEDMQAVITAIRNLRAEYKIEPKQKVVVHLEGADELKEQSAIIMALARLSDLHFDTFDGGKATAVVGGTTISLPLSGLVDKEKERERLKKELKSVESYREGLAKKLDNEEFVKNAPPAVIEKEKVKLAEAEAKAEALEAQMKNLAE